MYQLPSLPYSYDALAPVIGGQTMHIHHEKHHARYVEVVNGMTDGADRPLEGLISGALARGDVKLFNNAAQAWNHAFFWESMSPEATLISGHLEEAITASFGSHEGLRKEFIAKGVAQFGSGWVWLVANAGKLEVIASHDAEVPWLDASRIPLLVCDVWEHAYYLDYRNARDQFLGAWFDQLANWNFAAIQLEGRGRRYSYPLPS